MLRSGSAQFCTAVQVDSGYTRGQAQVSQELSPDRMPFSLNHFVDPEAMDIDLLAPLAKPAGSCLGSGELGEERHEGVADTACAVGLVL